MAVANVPQFGCIIDFTNGASFISTAFTLDSATKGILGTGQLADADDSADISDAAISCSIRRGRNRILDKFEAGSAIVTLRDDNGDFNPSNASGKYYGKLLPLRKIQIFADFQGTRYPLFYGFITSYTTQFTKGVDDYSKVILQCVDGFRLLNNQSFSTLAGAAAGDKTGARITELLDQSGWTASARAIDTGDSTVQADSGEANRVYLDALQLVGDKTEFGGLYIDKIGNINFLSRTTLSNRAAQPSVSYSDDGTAIGYQGIELQHDDVLVVNDVSVQRLGGTLQQVSDSTSIDTYFKHSGQRTGILLQSDAEALSQAQMLLATRKDATLRISSLNLNLFDPDSPDRVVAGLESEIFDSISVTKAMPGTTNITKTLFVQGVNHDMTKRSFDTRLVTAEPVIKAFILDSSTAGVLGGTEGLLSY
jgi:hypothetical protein